MESELTKPEVADYLRTLFRSTSKPTPEGEQGGKGEGARPGQRDPFAERLVDHVVKRDTTRPSVHDQFPQPPRSFAERLIDAAERMRAESATASATPSRSSASSGDQPMETILRYSSPLNVEWQ